MAPEGRVFVDLQNQKVLRAASGRRLEIEGRFAVTLCDQVGEGHGPETKDFKKAKSGRHFPWQDRLLEYYRRQCFPPELRIGSAVGFDHETLWPGTSSRADVDSVVVDEENAEQVAVLNSEKFGVPLALADRRTGPAGCPVTPGPGGTRRPSAPVAPAPGDALAPVAPVAPVAPAMP
jgi:hypothetical protein